jgi:hypothetical protein
MAKNYLDNLSEEVRKGQKEAVEEGDWPHAAPVGYVKVKREVLPDPITGVQVVEMFRLVAKGRSLNEVRDWARVQGLTATRRGRNPMGKGQAERIIKSPFYKGLMPWKGEVWPGNYPPLVSPELWERANRSLRGPEHQFQKCRRDDLLFHGLMTCGTPGCGRAVVGEVKKGGRYILYRCTHSKGNCTQGYVSERDLIPQFAEAVRRAQADAEIVGWIKEALHVSLDAETRFHRDALDDLTKQLDHVKRFKNKVYADHVEGLIDREMFVSMMNNYREQDVQITAALAAHQRADTRYLDEGAKILELAQHAESIYESRQPAEKKDFLKILLSNCVLLDGKISVTYRKAFELTAKFARMRAQKKSDSDLSEPDSHVERG